MAEKKDKHFIKKPSYPGGQEAFKKFISTNLKYPKEAKKNKIEGTVIVKYTIDYKGKVTDAKIIKSLGHGCDEEALRVIKLLEFEVPKEPRKLRVLFHKEAKLYFKIPKLTKPSTQQIQYTIKTKTKTPDQETKPSSGYSYTIMW